MSAEHPSTVLTESQHLLQSRTPTTNVAEAEQSATSEEESKRDLLCRVCFHECRRPHLIEAVLLCINVSYGAFSILNVQFLYHWLIKGAVRLEELPDDDHLSLCTSNSSQVRDELVKIQAYTGLWESLFVLVRLAPPILLTNSIIAYTQKVGRKFALLLATIGGSFAMAMYLMGNYYGLWLGYLVGALLIFGLSGGFYVPLACSFVYTMDHVPEEKRVFRYAIMNGISFLGQAVSTFTIGTVIESFGFSGAFTTVFLPFIFAVMYIICLLPESLAESLRIPQHETLPVFYLPRVVDMILRGARAVNRQREVSNSKVILRCLLVIALLDVCFFQCATEAIILRMLGPSLCLSASTISFACSVRVISGVVGPLLGARLFYRYRPESLGGIVSCMSGCIGFFIFGFTNSGAIVLLAFFIQSISNLNSDVYRSMMVKLVEPDERAVVHRLLSTTSSLGGLAGRVLTLMLFSAFVLLNDGVIFILFGLMYFAGAVIYRSCLMFRFVNVNVKDKKRNKNCIMHKRNDPAGSPVFSADCPSAEVVPLYTAVTIRCKVTSPSELTNSYFYWHHYVVIHLKDYEVTEEHEFKVIENNSSKITLLPVDKNEVIHSGSENTTSWAREGRYTGMVFPQANNSAILELKIEHMTNQMYRRHFFAVDNEFGTAEYVIELKRVASILTSRGLVRMCKSPRMFLIGSHRVTSDRDYDVTEGSDIIITCDTGGISIKYLLRKWRYTCGYADEPLDTYDVIVLKVTKGPSTRIDNKTRFLSCSLCGDLGHNLITV
ncbi:hypothetical protein CAPTEDRAFT_185178 [Capitella teleta]|uniref:Major facilitator superfamily (MFS) profile domain-containing protein n=1 Tax=Capitella teleta TaxID=283909 RepID=R7TTY6_CAPTE|nr:hypothetical protein CAPTEDRAFT_185178 [Capitella teleta]|eukprot:ELT97353.1 hypothetical protein CAPTEDRAFT_185178 [Capitella teleta]